MADNKQSRDKKAHDAANRQQRRSLEAELERGDEPEPPIQHDELPDIERALEEIPFPTRGETIVGAIGDRQLEMQGPDRTVAELLPDSELEVFETSAAVGERLQRPTTAEALKRIIEAVDTLPNGELGTSQLKAYRRTLLELASIDADDDDEGIVTIADWIIERIQEKQRPPSSRAVRREAAKYCRGNGYQVRNDEWLGI